MVPTTRKFWYASGEYVQEGEFCFCSRTPEEYFGKEPMWYHQGFLIQDEWGYTVGVDIWEDKEPALNKARNYLAKQIKTKQKELNALRSKLRAICGVRRTKFPCPSCGAMELNDDDTCKGCGEP